MLLALDIETTGLSPWEDDIVAVGLLTDEGNELVITPWDEARWRGMPQTLQMFFDAADDVVVHNAAFDLVWLKVKFGVDIPDNVWDTMIAEAALVAGYSDSVSLAETVMRRFQTTMDKELQTSFTLDEKPSKEQIEYLLGDIRQLLTIREQQQEELELEGLDDVWEIEKAVTPVFCSMIHDGIKINVPYMTKLIDREKVRMQSIQNEITANLTPLVMFQRQRKFDKQVALRKEHYQKVEIREQELRDEYSNQPSLVEWNEKDEKAFVRAGMKKWREYNKLPLKPKLDTSDINLSSPHQLIAAFNNLGVEITSTKAAELKAVLPNVRDPKARMMLRKVIEYKKSAKMVQAFGDALFQFLDDRDHLHGQFKQYGTQTGRPTCTSPNLLQMPNSDEFRSGFVAEDGDVLIVADFSQMELRLMAQLSGDRNMTRAFIDDLDLHTNTAALMFNVAYDNVTKTQRAMAKTLNFGILYGMGPTKLRATLAAPKSDKDEPIFITADEAKKTLNRWKSAYPQAAKTIVQWGNDAVHYGFTETAMGRKRRFRVLSSMTEWELGAIRRQGANHVVQGSNADITKMAMVMAHKLLKPLGGGIRLQVYDELVAAVPKEHAEKAADIIYWCMMSAAQEVLRNVPAAVDCVISRSWSEKEGIEVTA